MTEQQAAGKYQVMPAMSEPEFQALCASIAAEGMHNPVHIVDEPPRKARLTATGPLLELPTVLDGQHRLRAWLEAGKDIRDLPRFVVAGSAAWDDTRRRAYARRVNLIRRNLTPEQRGEIVAAQLAETPNASSRQIARMLGVSKGTVERKRKGVTGPLGQLEPEKRIGKDGKARKLPEKAVDPRIVAAARKGALGDPHFMEITRPVMLQDTDEDVVVGHYSLARWPDDLWTFGYTVELKSRVNTASRSSRLPRAPWRVDTHKSEISAVRALLEVIEGWFADQDLKESLTPGEMEVRDSWRAALAERISQIDASPPGPLSSKLERGRTAAETSAAEQDLTPAAGAATPLRGERGTAGAAALPAQRAPKAMPGMKGRMAARIPQEYWPRLQALGVARAEEPEEVLALAVRIGVEQLEETERRLAPVEQEAANAQA